jgi:hypothetical protein
MSSWPLFVYDDVSRQKVFQAITYKNKAEMTANIFKSKPGYFMYADASNWKVKYTLSVPYIDK